MIKKTLTYHGLEDERGNQEEYIEDFWFHISEANLRKMIIIDGEGIEEKIARLFRTNNRRAIYEFIEEFSTKTESSLCKQRKFLKLSRIPMRMVL